MEAIAAGKHVVTANKALLAVHGTEIFAAAHRAKGVMVAFEAAVAGGIPIIKALREGLTANRIQWIAGIINGTTNFILSEMRDKGLDFDVVLKEAQRLGYAEADPTFDIEGVDAAHKATHHVGHRVRHPGAVRQGLCRGHHQAAAPPTSSTPSSWATASSCWASPSARAKGIELRVHPSLVPAKRLIANVEGAMNAVMVQGDAVGTTLYYGKGAGSEPTASAVIADLVDITRLHTADAGAPRAAPGVPAGRHERPAGAADERGGHQLLPAPARGRPGRRAGQGDRHPGRRRHQHRRRAAARGR